MVLPIPATRSFRPAAIFAAAALALAGCNFSERIAGIGAEPVLKPIENPQTQPGYKAVSLPMPAPEPQVRFANSLWRPGARAFFKDQRAAKVGDILTITVTIADEADISNTTVRTRASTEDADLTNILGFEGNLGQRPSPGDHPRQCPQRRLDFVLHRGRNGEAQGDDYLPDRRARHAGTAERQPGDPGPPGGSRELTRCARCWSPA